MNILVTGGLGFVGVNIVRGLAAQAGVRVVAADILPWDEAIDRFLEPVRKQVVFRRLDVRDAGAVNELVEAAAISHIVHGAAITVADTAERARAAEIVAVNLQGSIHMLDAALASASVERLLLISSSGVYETPSIPSLHPQRETDPLALDNLYATTKHSAELLAARYAVLGGKPMAAVRLPGVYGPMERNLVSRPHTSAPFRLMVALRDGRGVRVAGPGVMRDWTYAVDIAAGISALLNAASWRYPVYNLSCGQAVSFGEVVQAFVEHGLSAEWVADADEADIAMRPRQERAPLDIARIRQDTSFRPAFSMGDGVDDWLRVEL